MPGSSDLFDDRICSLIGGSDYKTFLDIGAGYCKMGMLVRVNKGAEAKITGIDINRAMETNMASAGYDEIVVGDAVMWLFDNPDRCFDCVFICDCLEHLRKSDGIDVLNHLTIRSKKIVLKIPLNNKDSYLFQTGQNEYNSEAHISIWGAADFLPFPHSYDLDGAMQYVVITGYRR